MHDGEPDLRHHGDADAAPGLLDFAVNVQGETPPGWLVDRLAAVLPDLGRYPSAAHDARARDTVAARHGRRPDEVLLLAGSAEGFALLPALRPRLAAVLHPGFTEPEAAQRIAGWRQYQATALAALPGVAVLPGRAPYLLLRLPVGHGERVRAALRSAGIAVRRGDTFPGLGPDFVRVAVRSPAQVERLVTALSGALAEMAA